jgi:glucosamine-6-phosphate deaminase
VLNNHQAIAIRAAKEIHDAIKEKALKSEFFVLGLATGSTMEPVYAELIRMHQEEQLDFSQVKFFNLDNYVGLAQGDRNNYDEQLHRLFLSKVNVDPNNVNLVSSAIDFDHQAYEKAIKAAGGIDIQLLGIGRNGHIGFNEVGSTINSLTRKIALSQETKDDNGKYFNQIDKKTSHTEVIPLSAHTRGISPILEAKKIICLANGHAKAQAVKNIYKPGSVEELPVRALHQHSNVMTLVDLDALALFDEDDLTAHTNLDERQKIEVIEANQFYPVVLNIKGVSHEILLPQQFDFYNPKTMGINESFDYKNETHLTDLAACLAASACISVGAHPDDAEIMAGPMMLQATEPWLTLILTNGAATNNTLNGEYGKYTPEKLTQMRQMEQRQAARFADVPLIMCKFPTAAITGDMGENTLLKARMTMRGLFKAMKSLRIVYGHNPLDEHDTHINTFSEQVLALRSLSDERLKDIKVWGMEVWGILHVSKQRLLKIPIENKELLSQWRELIGFYQSQIAGQGRDYSEATIDRACGNAGYQTHPHGANPSPGLLLAADLTDLVQKKSLSINDMTRELMFELKEQVICRTERVINDRNSRNRKVSVTGNTSISFFPDPKKTSDEDDMLGGMSLCAIS